MPHSHESSPFRKVRRDHATETAEDYCEAVADIMRETGECRVRDLAMQMGVSHVTVTRIISRLQEADLVETEHYRPIRLTRAGQELAERSRRRHEIVLSFLLRIGVPEEEARRDAEGIEHHVGQRTLECMRRFVDGDSNESEP